MWVGLHDSILEEFSSLQRFTAASAKKDGLAIRVRKNGKYDPLYYKSNRNKIIERNRSWQAENRCKVLKYKKEYRKKYVPSDSTLKKRAEWRAANRTKLSEYHRIWRAENREKWLATATKNRRAYVSKYRLAGICVHCRKEPSSPSYYCESCKQNRKEYYHARRKKGR